MSSKLKNPVSQAPTRVPLDRQQSDFDMNAEWVRWFNQVSSFSYDIRVFLETLNPSTVAANTSEEKTFSVDGINTEDIVLSVNKPSHTTNLGVIGFRAGDNDGELDITFINHRGVSVDPPEEEYRIAVLKRK